MTWSKGASMPKKKFSPEQIATVRQIEVHLA